MSIDIANFERAVLACDKTDELGITKMWNDLQTAGCTDDKAALDKAKDSFDALKFDYVELQTKALFLEKLTSGAVFQNYDQESAHASAALKAEKKNFRVVKDENKQHMKQLTKMIAETLELQERFNAEKALLLAEVEALKNEQAANKKTTHMETQTTPAKSPHHALPHVSPEYLEQQRLEQELASVRQQQKFVEDWGGVRIIEKQGPRVVLAFDPLPGDYQHNAELAIEHDPDRGIITKLEFVPDYIPHQDIFEYGVKMNDVTFIVMELQGRLQAHKGV